MSIRILLPLVIGAILFAPACVGSAAEWVPLFDGKSIAARPTINIPKDCKPVEVPLDPALAIGKRFGTLIEQKTE